MELQATIRYFDEPLIVESTHEGQVILSRGAQQVTVIADELNDILALAKLAGLEVGE